ncbi:hypothetical protein B484DRAFT_444602, partial [Ochromonadaceae sp. CCMP2298]
MDSDDDNWRLGERRNQRAYAAHQRRTGLDAEDRMAEQNSLIAGCCLGFIAATHMEENNVSRFFLETIETLFVMVCCLFMHVGDLRTPRLCTPDAIPKNRYNFASLSDGQYDAMIGLARGDVQQCYDAMRIPADIILNPGTRHAFRVDGQHAFLYFLFRYRSPSQRQTLDQAFWGYDYSNLSKIFNTIVAYVDEQHAFRLRRLPEAAAKFATFNERIKAKLQEQYPNEALPPDADHCALFADGCRVEVSVPEGSWWVQHA